MKPEGLALDIAVVGLGQAGGNIAAEFFRRGYRAIALNTAQTDLSALEPGGVYPAMPAERRIYIGIDGYDGAGSDPAYGRECIAEHAKRIRNAVMEEVANADVVILAAGLGGGTGSALPELIKVLKPEELPIVALGTIPTEGESGLTKVNAVRAINELMDAELLGWIFVDNTRIAELNQDISIVDYYAHINGQIASPIDALNRLNDRPDLKAIRSFDGEDFRKLILSGGVLNYGIAELPGITTEEVVGTIKDAIEASELMPAGFEMSRLSYLGFVIEASEAVLAATPVSVFEEIHAELKRDTGGGAVYHGLYRSSEDGPTTLRLIAATQGLPHRISEVLADAKREGSMLGEKIREQLPTLALGEIEGFELFRTRGNNPSSRPRRAQGPRASEVESDHTETPTADGVQRKDLANIERVPDPRQARTQQRRPVRPNAARPSAPPPPRAPAPEPREALRATAAPREARPTPRATAATAPVEDEHDDDQDARHEMATGEIDLSAVAGIAAKQEVRAEDVETSSAKRGGAAAASAENEPRRRAPPSVPEPETGEHPSPELYDRLVNEYLGTKQPRAREDIVKRLEEDSSSEHTVIRYYAVEAMSKLGREVFGAALLAATEDENEAVRAIAVEALRR